MIEPKIGKKSNIDRTDNWHGRTKVWRSQSLTDPKFVFNLKLLWNSMINNPLKMSSLIYHYYQRPIGDRHAWSETHRRHIGGPSETYRRPIGDLSETHRRPTSLIVDPSETSTCFIGDPPETDMPQYIVPIYINKQQLYKNKNI